jgi:hypothetical protein
MSYDLRDAMTHQGKNEGAFREETWREGKMSIAWEG